MIQKEIRSNYGNRRDDFRPQNYIKAKAELFRLLTSSCCSGAWHKGFNNAQPPTSNLLQAVRFYQGDTGCPVPAAHLGDEKISRASVGQTLDQSADAVGSISPALRAVVIEEIITTTPQDAERIGIGGVTG